MLNLLYHEIAVMSIATEFYQKIILFNVFSAYTFTEPLNSKGVIVIMLKQLPDQRAVILGQYIIENKSTVRATAKKFGISKSTVHKDVSERLKKENPSLYAQVKDILEINKRERHIRGGMATKLKYEKIAENKVKYKY